MKILGNVVLVAFAGLICACLLSFIATFGVAFVGIAMAVLWMMLVHRAVDRLATRRDIESCDRRAA